MRFSKIALVAAAFATSAIPAQAQAVRPVTVLGTTETVTAIGGGGTLSTVDNILYNPAGGGTIAITPGETLTIFSEYATTVDAAFLELGDTDTANLQTVNGTVYKVDPITGLPTGGNIVKQGGGLLQINAWTTLRGTQRAGSAWWMDADGTLGHAWPMTANSWATGASNAPDLMPSVTGDPDQRNAARLNGLQGTFTIDQGTVRLAGFLNVWHDQGDNDTIDQRPFGPPPRYAAETADNSRLLTPRMTGVSGIILNGSSVLELTNSPLNIPTSSSTGVIQGSANRVQYLRNLQAGLANDQFQTELVVGTTAEYRALIHIDQGVTGSIGILSGAGSVVKSGAGDFIILNQAKLSGSFTVGGGRVILDSAEGLALASASSVNLAGTVDDSDLAGSITSSATTEGSRRGSFVRYLEQEDIDVNGDGVPDPLYKPAYAPAPGTRTIETDGAGQLSEVLSGAELEIRNDQTIRNFQSDFAFRATPGDLGTVAAAIQRAADVSNRGELVIAGTGAGASVILGGHTLTIRQDAQRDGLYKGRILGGFDYNATLVDEGAGTSTISFDLAPGFGTFQMRVTDAAGNAHLTDAVDISSAAEIRDAVASALGVASSAVTVTDATGELGGAIGWRIAVGAAGSVNTAESLRSGRVVLDATDATAKLGLILQEGSFAETEVRAGSLIVNAQGLGNSRINVSSGELRIFQNDTATLEASLLGAGTVRVVAFASVDNGSGSQIEINSLGSIGTLNFGFQQRSFTGELVINDGVDVSLSAIGGDVSDTLLNATAITLDGGDSGRGSTLRFNDTDQLVRNLAGDALSRIELGRGTMTLVQDSATRTFLGSITGSGSVIKRGSGNFNFRGVDDQGVGASDFTGALAVQQGSVSLGSANALRNVSAVALAAGTSLTAKDLSQTIGALFGEAGSTFDIGAATLTVGVTPARQADLRQQLETSFGLQLTLSHNYLGTSDAAYLFLNFNDPLFGPRSLVPSDLDRGPLRLADPVFGGVPTEADFLNFNVGMADQTRLYLERVLFRFDRNGDGVISPAEAAQAATTAATLGFAGKLTATGASQTITYGGQTATATVSLSKTGWETLRLLNDATGSAGNQFGGGVLVVRQGTLEATVNALATAGSVVVLANSATIDLDGDGVTEAVDIDGDSIVDGIDLNADGVFDATDHLVDGMLALNVGAGATATWSKLILGDGDFAKTGDGILILQDLANGTAVAQNTGLTGVLGGTLELTLRRASANPAVTNATLGAVFIDAGATLAVRTDSATSGAGTDFTYVAADGMNGEGTLRKLGRGTLSIDGALVDVTGGTRVDGLGAPLATLSFDVVEGTLRFTDSLPNLGDVGRVAVAAGATLEFQLGAAADTDLGIEASGAGTLLRSGAGILRLQTDPAYAPLATQPSLGFTGDFVLTGGDTSLLDPGAFGNARLAVRNAGTILRLAAGAFQFKGLTGEAGTEFALDPATALTIDVASGQTNVFLGHLTGAGDLTKTGAGTLSFDPGALVNDLGDISVAAGTLRATVNGIGTAASIDVLAGATLEFSAAAGEDLAYTAAITGAGSVAKYGEGRVSLTGAAALPSGTIAVNGGTLAVEDTRVGSVVPAATIAAGATLEILLTGNRDLGAQVAGSGNLKFSGAQTVTLQSVPAFSGYLALANGADLAFAPALTAIGIGGLAADAGSDVTLAAGQTLTLTQSASTDFNGTFLGAGNLVIRSSGSGENVFRYVANGGDLSALAGSVTVDGGALQVSGANLKAITLTGGGTLHISVGTGLTQTYLGALAISSGTSSFVKVGAGTIDLTAGLPTITGGGTFGGLVVREGRALVGVVGGSLLGGGQISLADTGSIAVSVGTGQTVTLTQTVATDGTAGGQFEKLGAGRLILQSGTTSADVLVTEGILQLGLSGAPASVGGDVTVAAGARLTGTASIAGGLAVTGAVAPGYSPGTMVVAGDLDFAAGSLYDAEILGGESDLISFGGALTISPTATLRLTGSAAIGERHALLAGAVGAAQFAAGQLYTNAIGSAGSVPFIVAYPGQVLGVANTVQVIAVRGTVAGAASATSLADPAALSGIDPAFIARLSELARVEVNPLTGQVTDLTQGALGRELAALSTAAAPAGIKSLTGVAYLSGLGMAHLAAAADNESLVRRTEQRRFDRGYMSVKSREFYVTATSGSWTSDDVPTSPGYDISRQGMMAGWDTDLTTSAFAGVAVSLDTSKAKLVGGGTVDAAQARVHAYASMLLDDDATFVEGGVFLGHARMDANRGALAGGASASPTAFNAGAWVRVGTAALLGARTSIAPFLQLDLSHSSIGGFAETGPDQTRLAVGDLTQDDIRGRVGFSLAQAWDSDTGGWRYRLSLDVAYVSSLAGESVTTEATNAAPNGIGNVTATADPLDRGGLLVTPAFTFGPDHDTSYGVSAEFRRLDGGSAASVNLSYRRRF